MAALVSCHGPQADNTVRDRFFRASKPVYFVVNLAGNPILSPMKKSSKRFTLSSERKNSQGFRVRTAGVELNDFLKNPILLWMHQRPKGENANEILPLGYWDDIKVDGDKITGIPVFDDTDPFAMKIANKVENGTIKMASAGLRPIEFAAENGEDWLIKSALVEGTLCDIGSNGDALAVALYNTHDELVTLADVYDKESNKTQINTTMKTLQLTAGTLSLLKLAEGANEADAHTAILNLVTLSASQKSQIEQLKAAKEDAEKKLAAEIKLKGDAELITLVDKAVEERKITADQKPHLLKMALEDAKGFLGTIPSQPTVKSKLNQDGAADTSELMKLSYEELDKANKLITLKEKNLEGFKEKFKAHFGREYSA